MEYMVVNFCHLMHPLVYLTTLCWNILLEKHPQPVVIDESAFLPCDDLPPLLDLDITANYVEHVAHQIQRSVWPF